MLDASDVKKININRIRSVMWRGGEHTKQSVARETGLSVATCNTFLNEMECSGEITSDKRQLNGVGRSTGIYRINEAYESILCIRIDLESDGHRILGFDVLSMLKTVLFHKNFCYKTLSKDAIQACTKEILLQFPNISCIMVGTSGIVDHGVIQLSDIPEIENMPLVELIQKQAGEIPVYAAYDCQYRVYGAYKQAGYTTETMTLFFCMKNILPGTASIVHGRCVIGKNGFAGMNGYMPFDVSREELIKRIADTHGLSYMVTMIASVITILNPDEMIFGGNVVDQDMLDQIKARCEAVIPPKFLPVFRMVTDNECDYLEGMYQMALELKVNIEV